VTTKTGITTTQHVVDLCSYGFQTGQPWLAVLRCSRVAIARLSTLLDRVVWVLDRHHWVQGLQLMSELTFTAETSSTHLLNAPKSPEMVPICQHL
jgi:hypothetical protein